MELGFRTGRSHEVEKALSLARLGCLRDMIMDSINDMEHEPEHERDLVAEEGAKLVAEDELVAEEKLVAEDVLVTPAVPMTRSRAKLFDQAIAGMLNHIWDRPNDLSQVTTSLVLIQAQGPHQDG